MSSKYQRALRTMKHYVLNVISEEQARQQEENSTTKPKNLVSSLVAAIKKESSERGTSLTPNEVFDE
ncbi:unnamed protein product, partial [Rotaria magnacalcarata]